MDVVLDVAAFAVDGFAGKYFGYAVLARAGFDRQAALFNATALLDDSHLGLHGGARYTARQHGVGSEFGDVCPVSATLLLMLSWAS